MLKANPTPAGDRYPPHLFLDAHRTLMQRLNLQRREQVIPCDVRERIVKTKQGPIDTIAWEVLSHSAAWFHFSLTEELPCHLIEIVSLERYQAVLQVPEINQLRRLWVVEVAGQTCFVAQGMQEGWLWEDVLSFSLEIFGGIYIFGLKLHAYALTDRPRLSRIPCSAQV